MDHFILEQSLEVSLSPGDGMTSQRPRVVKRLVRGDPAERQNRGLKHTLMSVQLSGVRRWTRFTS